MLTTHHEALQAREVYYFTGEACPKGHISPRQASNRGCIECLRERNGKWMNDDRAANRDKYLEIERASRAKARERLGLDGWRRRAKKYNLFHKYGIRLEHYERMLAEQGGLCAICGKPPVATKNNNGYLDVDHDHISGVIRGLLCHPCNQGMIAVDRVHDWTERAARYVAQHRRA